MRVEDIMTADVATVPDESTAADCARRMLSVGAGSVVVTVDDSPAGIVTESDVLRAGAAGDAPLSAIPTRRIMSHPIKWVRPDATARAAAEKMHAEGVKKLVVVEDAEMRGIVTVSDVAFHVSDVARDVDDLLSMRDRWESDRRFR